MMSDDRSISSYTSHMNEAAGTPDTIWHVMVSPVLGYFQRCCASGARVCVRRGDAREGRVMPTTGPSSVTPRCNAFVSPRTAPHPLDAPQDEKRVDISTAGWDGKSMGQGAWLTVVDP